MDVKDLKQLQQTELSILISFDEYCKKHNLKYYLVGGALLGAARYKGFIPWDDDIDVAMPRKDYEQLKECWKAEEMEGYFLQNGETDKNFSRCIQKIRKNNTEIIEGLSGNVKMNNGIYIDIFPVDFVASDDEAIIGKKAAKIRRLMSLRAIRGGYRSGGIKSVVKRIVKVMTLFISPESIDRCIDKLCMAENDGETNYAILYLHNYEWKKQIHKKDVFGEGGFCEFEGHKFSAPEDTDAFLEKVFGDGYMNEPQKEKQKNPHNYISVCFDTEKRQIEMEKRKILFVTNEPFSQQSSNGRTLMNLVRNTDCDSRAQFFLHGSPDEYFCKYYYKVTDGYALKSIISISPLNPPKIETISSKENNSHKLTHSKSGKRSCRNYFIRSIVWLTYRWWNGYFDQFLKQVNPGVVFLQAGDAPFMYAIALRIAKKYNAKLVMYNSESFPLKDRLYSSSSKYDPWHFALKKLLRFYYGRFMKKADYCFYSMEELEKDYRKIYTHNGGSKTLYIATDMKNLTEKVEGFNVSYCGNLGVGRVKPLSEFAMVLKKTIPDATLNIYGKFINEEDEKALCENENVKYHGIIPYDEIPEVMSKATVLLHCENEEKLENLRYAFSTKIADSLACGRPFMVYASEDFPFVKYLKENKVAHIAGSQAELENILIKMKNDEEYRNMYIPAAIDLAHKNHNLKKNCEYVQDVLNQLL